MVCTVEKPISKKIMFSDYDIKTCDTEIPVWVKGMKVMIVRGDNTNETLLEEKLVLYGLEVRTFLKAVEAAEAARNERFDLFLLEIFLPGMSGFELAEIIRKTEINSFSLIMFISSSGNAEDKIKCYNLGSCAYIEKPFDNEVVSCQIINALKNKQLNDAMNNTKESFIALVAHDLKSPINSEIAALEILLKSLKNNNVSKEFLSSIIDDIIGATKYMKNLVENVINKHKYDNSKFHLNKEYNSLKVLAEECIKEAKYLILDKKLTVNILNKAKTKKILLDYIEIKRVIHNLLVNAVENTPKSSDIEIVISENKKYVVFSIKNPSKGFSIPNQEDIFDKFISNANKNKTISSGLGLHIAKNIIVAHGGSINIDTKDPKYIRFVFTLPK